MIPGKYKSKKPIISTGVDKIHLNCDCVNGSIVNGTTEPILYSFGLTSLPRQKIHNQSKVNVFKKRHKSVLSHIGFYFEDDDHKPVYFNAEMLSFTGQLIKIQ